MTRVHIYLPTYSVGKERVYLHVARELNISLYVDSGKRRVLGYVEAKPCGTWPASAAREAAGHAELDLAPKEASGGSTTAEAPYFRHRCSIASAYLQRTSRASPPTPPPPVGVSSPWLRCGSTARARSCSSAVARYATQGSNPGPADPRQVCYSRVRASPRTVRLVRRVSAVWLVLWTGRRPATRRRDRARGGYSSMKQASPVACY
jgi:hypothetical protein